MKRVDAKENKKHAPVCLGRVLVLGLGKSGRAAVEYCLDLLGSRVQTLAVAAGAPNEDSLAFAQAAEARGAYVSFGDNAVEELMQRTGGHAFDLCIPSPGIPPFSPLYVAARANAQELISEVEFAWRESAVDSLWVAVTGTNGKTTVASCVAHVLQASNLRAAAVGNIGDTCLAAVASGEVDVYVAEVSSYQLASTVLFAPNVAVVLNITPDHLHWHTTFESYCEAKFKLLENLTNAPRAVAILDATNNVVRNEVRRLRALPANERGFAYVALGTAEGIAGDMRKRCGSDNAAFIDADNTLVVAVGGSEQCLVRTDELLVQGAHNASNALAAAAVALVLGVDANKVSAALRTFSPLEHRIEPCGKVAGVQCFNDSKATNVDATLTALVAFPHTKLVVLLGGDDKGTDLAPLVQTACEHARAVVCFGAAGERFAQAFAAEAADCPSVLRAQHLEDALDVALEVAQEGEVILLSPACASFDEFSSYEERGHVFKALVAVRATSAQV